MINLYDQPAQAQFMQTYVPVPFEELMQTGAMQQQRWEDMVQAEDALQTEFGNIQYLRNVTDVAGNVYETGIEKYAQEAVGEFQKRLEDITTGIADKTSPEYRARVRNLITDWRKANGPQGQLGRMAADVGRYQEWRKGIDEAKIGSKTHRGIYSDIQMQGYLGQLGKEYIDFNVGAPVLKDVDIHKELNETLKNVGEVVLSNPKIASMPMDQILRYHSSGVGYERLVGITKELIVQNEDIKQDIIAQELAKGKQGEDLEKAVNARVEEYADTMAKIYTKQKLDTSWTTDEMSIYSKKKQLEDSSAVFATKINLPYVTAKGFKGVKDLKEGILAAEQTIKDNTLRGKDMLIAEWGINPEHIVIDEGGLITLSPDALAILKASDNYRSSGFGDAEIDISKVINDINQSILQSKRNLADIQNLERIAREQASRELGLTPEKIQQLEYEADTKAAEAMEMESKRNPNMSPEEYRKKYDMFYSQALNDGNLGERMDEIIKQLSSKDSFEASVVNMPKSVNEFMERNLTIFDSSTGLKWADSEKHWEDVSPKERDKIDFTKNPPKFGGFFYDQNTGSIQALYKVRDKDGKSLGTVQTDIPDGTEEYLYEQGLFDEFNSIVYTNLFNQLSGIANSYSRVGKVLLPGDLTVEYLGKNSSGQYVVNIPTSRGLQARTFGSVGEMVGTLGAMSRKLFQDKINKLKK